MFRDNRQNWNEFQWECELRKDEKRINSYFQELDSYIDLPHEEDIIMKKLMSRPELKPVGVDGAARPLQDCIGEDYDDFLSAGDWRSTPGGSIVMRLERLAFEYSLLFSGAFNGNLAVDGMSDICMIGKMLARASELISCSDSRRNRPLSRCLCKHLHHDLNDMLHRLERLGSKVSELQNAVEKFNSEILAIREDVLNFMSSLDKPASSNDEEN